MLVGIAAHPAAIGEVFNIGSAQEITIADLATRSEAMTNSDSRIVLIPYDQAYEEGFVKTCCGGCPTSVR